MLPKEEISICLDVVGYCGGQLRGLFRIEYP